MMHKAVSWLLGVGIYFTLKQTFPYPFADALDQEPVDENDLAIYGVRRLSPISSMGRSPLCPHSTPSRDHMTPLSASDWIARFVGF